MFTDKENELRTNNFLEMVSNIKGAVIVKKHEEYLLVSGDRCKDKIQSIITDKFDNNGWVQIVA
jgi:hypothetical protein